MTAPSITWVMCLSSVVTIDVVQLLSCVWLFVTSWTTACQSPVSSTVFWSLLKFMSIESVMLSNHLIRGSSQPRDQTQVSWIAGRFFTSWATREAPSSATPSPFAFSLPQHQDLFQRVSSLHWAKYECWISLQSKGLSSLQQNNSKASILWCLVFIRVQLSHLYMTTRETRALIM